MSLSYNDPAPTLEDIWRLFRETSEQMKETDRLIQDNARAAEQRSKELDHKFQETDRKFQEMVKENREMEQVLRQQIGQLGNRLGEFVQGMIKPAAVRLFKERGIEVHKVNPNVEVSNPHLNLAMEIDLLVVNGDCCVLIEVKSNLSMDDVNEHLERMTKFKPLFPEYADKKALGAVAGMIIAENVAKYAYRKGFFVIGQRGDAAVILNDDKFQPTAW
jgi:hypothetical protein